jgi:hypothetical protein
MALRRIRTEKVNCVATDCSARRWPSHKEVRRVHRPSTRASGRPTGGSRRSHQALNFWKLSECPCVASARALFLLPRTGPGFEPSSSGPAGRPHDAFKAMPSPGENSGRALGELSEGSGRTRAMVARQPPTRTGGWCRPRNLEGIAKARASGRDCQCPAELPRRCPRITRRRGSWARRRCGGLDEEGLHIWNRCEVGDRTDARVGPREARPRTPRSGIHDGSA